MRSGQKSAKAWREEETSITRATTPSVSLADLRGLPCLSMSMMLTFHAVRTSVPKPPATRNRDLADTRRYAQAAREVGVETGTVTVDLFAKWTEGAEADAWKGYLLDGLHL
jgi:hypothetical protein